MEWARLDGVKGGYWLGFGGWRREGIGALLDTEGDTVLLDVANLPSGMIEAFVVLSGICSCEKVLFAFIGLIWVSFGSLLRNQSRG